MVLFRNPFRHFPVYADMSCSSDDFKPSRAPLDNPLNTGLYYMKSTNRTIEMMKYWRAARERFPGQHDQAVFVNIRHELVGKLHVKIEPLDTVYYTAGSASTTTTQRRSAPSTPTAALGWTPRCTISRTSPRTGRTTRA